MLVEHRACPNCGTYIEESNELPICLRCGQSIQAEVSEEEYKRNEHKYRMVDTSTMGKMTDAEAAQWEDMFRAAAEKGSKPFLFMKNGVPVGKGKFPTGLVWLAVFILLAVSGVIFLFKTFDWYSLIVIVVFTLITLYMQKHHKE